MHTLYTFLPGLSETYRSGGLMVAQEMSRIISSLFKTTPRFVTTHETHPDAITPDEAFAEMAYQKEPPICLVTWGPLIEKHIKLVKKNAPTSKILYYAQSFGWNISVPAGIPIICVSRFVMAQWALHAKGNFCAYIPPVLNSTFTLTNTHRDIDILVHLRKQNPYCQNHLLPALEKLPLRLEVIKEWIPQEELSALLNRTKLFLYITAPHRAGFGRLLPGEGFGLPPLEALACGAMIGSNLLGGVTDFLTPGENCIKLDNGDLAFDLRQIQTTLQNFRTMRDSSHDVLHTYSRDSVTKKWQRLLNQLYTV